MKTKFRLTIDDDLLCKAQDLATRERTSLDDFIAQLMEKIVAKNEKCNVIPQKRTRNRK